MIIIVHQNKTVNVSDTDVVGFIPAHYRQEALLMQLIVDLSRLTAMPT